MKKITVNSRMVPVFRDTGFDFRNAEETRQAFADELGHPHNPENFIYSRYRNPTVTAVEMEVAHLEGANWSLLTQSGMSAIEMALSVFQHAGNTKPWLFFSEIYGGTNSFIDKVLVARRGLKIYRFVTNGDRHDLNVLEQMIDKIKPGLVYFEAVSNPMLITAPARRVIRLAREAGARVLVDNTFLTPWLWKPLQDDADLVIHSATKYLSGHGNLSAGVVSGNDEALLQELIEYRKLVGHMLSPDDAYRLGSFIKSFDLRMERHCQNASALADLLRGHPSVERVLYPGLEDHPTHPEAKELTGDRGYGGMITFDMMGKDKDNKQENRDKLIELLRDKIPLVPTLGDADTILLPIEPVWGDKYPEPGMIRLSAGLEDTRTLLSILKTALGKI